MMSGVEKMTASAPGTPRPVKSENAHQNGLIRTLSRAGNSSETKKNLQKGDLSADGSAKKEGSVSSDKTPV
ncbi:hypothetical protein [Erwinia amylovora]|uniref:hypothetical protein n=2 Tax=Erwinia amylovora TaxID=552 RepID=UPI0012BD6751|nr:hypothetical protein [Erwinia amylovora]